MSDVVLSTTESVTTVTVVDDVVQVAVTTNPVEVSSSTAGVQGATGAQGVGYNNVSSTSSVPVSIGLHTWTVASVGAFLPGMRVRAIHTDTPSIWVEGFCNVASGTTIIITADKISGSGTHNTWKFASAGEIGATGATGPQGSSGVIAVTAPITNTGTSTSANIGIDQSGLTLAQSQVTGLVSALSAKANLAGGNAFTEAQTITGSVIGDKVLVVKGASGQTANLFEVQDSTGTFRVRINQVGNSTFAGNITSQNNALFTPFSAATVPLTVQGAASQTASVLALQNSAGSITANFTAPVNNVNRLNLGGTDLSATLGITVHASGGVGQVIRGAASQTADLLQIQNSASTVLSKLQADGGASFASGNATISSGGVIRAVQVNTISDLATIREANSGGFLRMTRQTGALTNPGANIGGLYFRDGTTLGTLKLVVRAGAAGAETTILDNIPQ